MKTAEQYTIELLNLLREIEKAGMTVAQFYYDSPEPSFPFEVVYDYGRHLYQDPDSDDIKFEAGPFTKVITQQEAEQHKVNEEAFLQREKEDREKFEATADRCRECEQTLPASF